MPLRPVPSREVTGNEALLAHLIDSRQRDDTFARSTDAHPMVLGRRTLSAGSVSIAEVMHSANDEVGVIENDATAKEDKEDSTTEVENEESDKADDTDGNDSEKRVQPQPGPPAENLM